MASLALFFVLFLQIVFVFGHLCVLEPLVTISQPVCVQESCSASTNSNTTRRKRSTYSSSPNGSTWIPLSKPGSASLAHFQSVDADDDEGFGPQISNRFFIYAAYKEVFECNENDTYRMIDGYCNNIDNPTWGKSATPFLRILYPRYSSNSSKGIALAVSGNPLPEPRVISTTLFPDVNRPAKNHTLAVMQWGQLIAHDIGLSGSATNDPIDCCAIDTNPPYCYPIDLPVNDTFYSQFNQTCLNLIRTQITTEVAYNCKHIPMQINSASHYIDLSHLYGYTEEILSSLRQYEGGLLEVHLTKTLREFPKLSDNPVYDCSSEYPNITCFHSGDKRVNQNTQLTCLQTVLLREHNRIATTLAQFNNWTDEILFQESRNILIAQFQHINYNEYLPLILGDDYMSKHNLKPLTDGYTQYRNDINAGTINSFMTAAFRVFHSQIQGKLTMYNQTKCPYTNLPQDEGRCPFRSINISDYMNRPGIVVQGTNYDSLLLGLTVTPSQRIDRYFTTQMTEMLFHDDEPYGEDLESFDIQRGRDHGIPSYNTIRKLCNLTDAKEFSDLQEEISEENINLLASVYENVEDIDYFVGAVIENWVEGATVGPTALCIIGEQFVRKKYGDRFWYEAGNMTHSFTEEQLQEIRKSTFSRLLCDNSDNITTIQPNSFLSASVTGNEIVDCNTLPSLNLTKWKE